MVDRTQELDEHLVPGEHYVRFSADNPRGYGNRSGVYKSRIELDFLSQNLPPPPARVLDVAGGSGRIAIPLAERGYSLTVNDTHAASVRLVQRRGALFNLCAVHGDFFTSEFEAPFDSVLAVECLDIMPFDRVVERAAQLLRPQGTFVFTLLNRGSWRFLIHKFLGREQENECFLTLHEHERMWTAAGFELIAMRGYMWLPVTGVSNSPLIPICAVVERALRLHAYHAQSPWLMVALRRH